MVATHRESARKPGRVSVASTADSCSIAQCSAMAAALKCSFDPIERTLRAVTRRLPRRICGSYFNRKSFVVAGGAIT